MPPEGGPQSAKANKAIKEIAPNGKDESEQQPFDFYWVETDEPHATRRKVIIKDHPELRELFAVEPKTFPVVVTLVLLQFYLAHIANDVSWTWFFVIAYVFGGTINHNLQLACHELSHNLCFETHWKNKALGIFANLCTGVPSACSFQKYHMKHHQFQGVDGVDVDVPTDLELRFITNPLTKLFFIFFQPLFYAIRPFLMYPLPLTTPEKINSAIVLSANVVIVYTMGMTSFGYLLASSLLGNGLHPCAGHFIAEHYMFVTGQETYSYYGPCNYFNLNVGYHNEHHDFPRIPWTRLPLVRKIAPEYYENLPHHTSYVKVLFEYIFNPTIGPYSRIKRPCKNHMNKKQK